jgi:MFS family permease
VSALLARYRSALGFPGMTRVMSAAFTSYLLAGMMNLSLLLSTERITGSYASAGLVCGAYAVALAFAAPVWGRAVDRRGPRLPLALAVTLQAVTASVFIVMAFTVTIPLLLAGMACLVGACTPPTSTVARRAMMTLPDEKAQRTLFAMSGFFAEFVFVIGPLIVAAVVAFLNPLWAVGIAAVASGTGALVLRGSGPARELDRAAVHLCGKRTSHAASWNPPQIRILLVIALGAFAIGAVQVSVVAHAQTLNSSAGVFVAVLAAGGALASFFYGGLSLPGSLPLQLVVCLSLYGVFILTFLLSPGFLLSLLLLFLIGAATGPADGIEAMLVGQHTPPAAQSQAFAVLVTANWIGFAIGSGIGGALIEDVASLAGMAAGGLSALAAAALVLTVRRAAPLPAEPVDVDQQ